MRERARKLIALVLVGATLSGPVPLHADGPELLDPTFDPIDVRAARIEKVIAGEATDTDELEYWMAFLLAAGLMARAIPGAIDASTKTFFNLIESHMKKGELQAMERMARNRYRRELEELERAVKEYQRAREAWEAQDNRTRRRDLRRAAQAVLTPFNRIIEAENGGVPAIRRKGTLAFDEQTRQFHIQDPIDGPVPLASTSRDNVPGALTERAQEACRVGYQAVAGELRALRWQRARNWAWPLFNTAGFAGSFYWWRQVAKRRQDRNGGMTPPEILSEKITTNAQKLSIATDLAHQLTNLQAKEDQTIMDDFRKAVLDVLKHNEDRIIEYYKKHVPEEVQDAIDVEDLVRQALSEENANKRLRVVLPRAMAAAGLSVNGPSTPQDILGIIGTKDKAIQETVTTGFLIYMYADLLHRLWPKLAFKNTNADSHMILISPMIQHSLERMRGVQLRIRKELPDETKEAAVQELQKKSPPVVPVDLAKPATAAMDGAPVDTIVLSDPAPAAIVRPAAIMDVVNE